MEERIKMKMFIAGLITGAVGGSVLGVGLMCLLTAGKWADEEMELMAIKAAERDCRPPEKNIEESQVDGCGNETM